MLIKSYIRFMLVFFLGLPGVRTGLAENWPQWRGPEGNGISEEKNLATEWSREKNIAWRLPLPGPAGSTPVVWDDRIYLTSVELGDANDDSQGADLVLICANTEGKQLWRRVVTSGNQNARVDEGNFASPSPCTDGEHVWCLMGNGVLACYDKNGELTWKKDLNSIYGKIDIQFGLASTPVLYKDQLYLQLIHGDGNAESQEARAICLQAGTGDEVWASVRQTDARMECEHSYASPILYHDKDNAYFVTHGADYVIAYDLNNGKELWRCGGINGRGTYHETLRLVASPVAVAGLIVAPTAKNGPILAIRPDGKEDITSSDSYRAWTRPSNTPDVPSPLIYDGLVYLCRENGDLLCLDAKSGDEVYMKRTERDRHRASPVFADGNIYLASRRGVVSVIKAGPKFELIASNDLKENISSSLVIANGTIYIRTFDALYAIRKGE